MYAALTRQTHTSEFARQAHFPVTAYDNYDVPEKCIKVSYHRRSVGALLISLT